MEPESGLSRIAVARIVRTRGNRGEVLAELHTDFPERFDGLEEVWLDCADHTHVRARLERVWDHKGRKVLKFEGYDTIAAAEVLVGAWVEVEDRAAVKLPEGTYFDHDLVGCDVVDRRGTKLGVTEEVLRIPGNHLLVVRRGDHSFLIPASGAICLEVSVERKRIVVELPEGLVDLNK